MTENPVVPIGEIAIPVPWLGAVHRTGGSCWWCQKPLDKSPAGLRCRQCRWGICQTCEACACPYEIVRIKGTLHLKTGHKRVCDFQRFRVNGSHYLPVLFEEDIWEWRMQVVNEWLGRVKRGEKISPPWWEFPQEKLLLKHWFRDEFPDFED